MSDTSKERYVDPAPYDPSEDVGGGANMQLDASSWRLAFRRLLRHLSGAARSAETEGAAPGWRNMLAAATLIAAGALMREESRGGHHRLDFPQTAPERADRTRLTLAEAEALREEVGAEG